MIERLSFGTAQVTPGTTRVSVRPDEHLTIGLGVSATSPSELDQATTSLWTNYGNDDPRTFTAVPMASVASTDGHHRAFEVTLPPARLGTFLVTAYVETGGARTWASQLGSANLALRVRSPEIGWLHVRQVPIDKANARADSTDISTIEDMLGDAPGRYSLAWLQRQGVNWVWVQVPYRLDLWDGLPAVDDAGSDYASTDWFSIDPELSVQARSVPSWDLDEQRRVANAAMRRFVDEAHERGMKVLFEIAPNHVGHNYVFRDDVTTIAGAVQERRNNARVVVSPEQLSAVEARLASTTLPERIKDYAEWMLPQLYAARHPDGSYNPFGANSVEDTYSPAWYGRWDDTKHLNHGGHAGQEIWEARTEQNFRVLAYIGRAMRWAVVELGADGFRIDHTYGMPYQYFDQILPWVEMEAREHAGKASLVGFKRTIIGRTTAPAWATSSSRRGTGHPACAHPPGRRAAVAALRRSDVGGGVRGHRQSRRGPWLAVLPGDLLAYGNAVITLQLLGGPMTMLAGDEFAEAEQLRFKARGGIPTAWQFRTDTLPTPNKDLAYWVGRGGVVRTTHPALRSKHRERLFARDGAVPSVLAAARFVDDPTVVPLLVFNNLSRDAWTTGTYDVGQAARRWLTTAPDAFYQVRDLIGFDPKRPMWRRPLVGRDLLDGGLSIGLQPYQIQALELERLA